MKCYIPLILRKCFQGDCSRFLIINLRLVNRYLTIIVTEAPTEDLSGLYLWWRSPIGRRVGGMLRLQPALLA